MSAEKPEVGDVWRSVIGIANVVEISSNAVRIVYKPKKFKPKFVTFSIVDFLECFSYIGKSKARIEDLFEVE